MRIGEIDLPRDVKQREQQQRVDHDHARDRAAFVPGVEVSPVGHARSTPRPLVRCAPGTEAPKPVPLLMEVKARRAALALRDAGEREFPVIREPADKFAIRRW